MPYFSLDGTPDVKVELRIDGPTTFVLLHGFRYVDPDDNGREWKVDDNLVTDLASVPFFLQWLVRSYGKHTKGALIHDQHWDGVQTSSRLHDVNQVFRDAMREDGVPLVRRWLVWSAVSIAGLAKIGAAGWARLVLFVAGLATLMGAAMGAADADIAWRVVWIASGSLALLALVALLVGLTGDKNSARRDLGLQVTEIDAGYAVLICYAVALSHWEVVQDHAVWVLIAAAAVAVFAALPNWRASAIASAMALLVVVPTTAVFAALAVYGVFELICYGIRYPIRTARHQRSPAPLVADYIGRPPV